MSRPSAREAILSRLSSAVRGLPPGVPPGTGWSAPELELESRVDTFARHMRSVHTDVRRVASGQWRKALAEIFAEKKPATLAYGPGAWFAGDLAGLLKQDGMPEPRPYTRDVEQFRDELFGLDASVTSAQAGIAETGAVLLVPGPGEPRLLSLVPPLHIVLLRASDILSTFAQAIDSLDPASGMPPNSVLVTGPSKTADIELTLALGVHGPKELVVVILD